MNEQLKEAVSEAIREALGGALDCGRVWSAWGVGTMSEDDFSPVADDAERVEEIADAVLDALAATGKQQVGEVQGDALKALDDLAAFCSDDAATVDRHVAVIRAELAARQPADYHGDVDLKWLSGSIGEVAHRLRTYMPHLAEWTDRARDCGIAAKVLEDLAARQPGAQEPVGFQIMRRSADDTCFNGRWDNPPSGFHDDREYYVSQPGAYRIRDIYAAPPAQGIDLGQLQDAERYRYLRSKLATSDLHIILSRKGIEVEAADYVDSEIDKVIRNG